MSLRYSIAIRTLGTAGVKFRQELESIARQTIQPERVVVYVAETSGVKFVDGTIGKEEYRYVRKGMVAQRALPYEELTSPYLLLLDDDVELAPDSVERLLMSLVKSDVDAVGADIFKNQEMSQPLKVFAILSNWVSPHRDTRWAYKVTRTGAFSYLSANKIAELRALANEGTLRLGLCLPTQKLDGPCVMWKKDTLLALRWEDEQWMDRLSEFAYGDDLVESYKCYVNGGKLLLNYDAGVTYLNAKTASSTYHHTHKKYYIRSLMSALIWYRTRYEVNIKCKKENAKLLALSFALKCVWLLLVNIIAGVLLLDLRIPVYYVQGLVDAWRFAHSEEYARVGSYHWIER